MAEFDLSTLIALLVAFIILSQAIKIVREYERVVIFRLGRFSGVKGPGIFFIIPIIDRVMLLDLRVFTIDVAKQVVITKDNVSVEVDAVIYYRVVDPSRAIIQVENYKLATSLLAQTTLRDVLGQIELDDLLSKRDELNKKLQEILDRHTDPWGIKVTAVTLRDVSLPESMRRAIAKQAESEREKRSRIILADGEFQASKTMTDAARLYEEVPAALKLRELQTSGRYRQGEDAHRCHSQRGRGDGVCGRPDGRSEPGAFREGDIPKRRGKERCLERSRERGGKNQEMKSRWRKAGPARNLWGERAGHLLPGGREEPPFSFYRYCCCYCRRFPSLPPPPPGRFWL